MCLLWLENRECRGPDPAHPQKALGVKLRDRWSRADAVFDDENLVSCAGLVPVMGLAEQTGLSELIGQRVRWKTCRVASAGANPARKLSAIIAGMAAGADSIDDLDLSRCGAGASSARRWRNASTPLADSSRLWRRCSAPVRSPDGWLLAAVRPVDDVDG